MKNRKTVLHVIFAVVMAMSLTLSACTKAEAPNNTATNGPTKGVDATGDPNLVAYNTPLTTFMEPFTGAQDPYAGLAANLGVIPADGYWDPTGFTGPTDPATYTTFVVTSVNGVGYNSSTNISDLVSGLGSVSNPSTTINNATVYYAQVTVSINQASTNPSFASLDNASSPVVISITATSTGSNPSSQTNLTVVLEPVNPVGVIKPEVNNQTGVRVIVDPSAYNTAYGTAYPLVDTYQVAANGVFAPMTSGSNPASYLTNNYNNTIDPQIAQRYVTPISALASIASVNPGILSNTVNGVTTDYAFLNTKGIVFQAVQNPNSNPVYANDTADPSKGFSYVSGIDIYTDLNSTSNDQVMAAFEDAPLYRGWNYMVYDNATGLPIAAAQSIGAGAFWVEDNTTVYWYWGTWGSYPPDDSGFPTYPF